jgi:toxin FitB
MRADARMATWLSSVGVDDRVVICTVACGEILFGLERLAQGRRRTELEEKAWNLFAVLPCEPIPPAGGDLYATVKISQQRRGLPLDENDLWIAATALAMHATLVSRDTDFHGITLVLAQAPAGNSQERQSGAKQHKGDRFGNLGWVAKSLVESPQVAPVPGVNSLEDVHWTGSVNPWRHLLHGVPALRGQLAQRRYESTLRCIRT